MRSSILIAAAALFVMHASALAQYPASVRVDSARTETLAQLRGVTGDIRSTRRALIASQVEGLVDTLALEEGDRVDAGQVIATLDATTARLNAEEARAALEAARASVEEEQAMLDRAQRDLNRVLEAERRGSSSATEIDRFRTDVAAYTATLAAARARVGVAEADLGRREKDLADMTIRAPFAGAVISKRTEVGEWVSVGDPVVEIVSLTELEAWIEVPEQMIRFLDADAGPIALGVPAAGQDAGVTATLIGVVPLADELSRLFPVRLRVPNPEGVLKPGMSLTAYVPTGRVEPTLTIHKDAVLRDDAGEYVYMAAPSSDENNPAINGSAVPARITRLYAVGERVAIRPGQIQEGTAVLVEGNERVRPSQPLIITNPPAGSPFARAASAPTTEAEGG